MEDKVWLMRNILYCKAKWKHKIGQFSRDFCIVRINFLLASEEDIQKGILMPDRCLTWWTLMVFPGLPLGLHCLGRTVGAGGCSFHWGWRAPRRAYTIRQHQPWESTSAPPRKKWGLHKNTLKAMFVTQGFPQTMTKGNSRTDTNIAFKNSKKTDLGGHIHIYGSVSAGRGKRPFCVIFSRAFSHDQTLWDSLDFSIDLGS